MILTKFEKYLYQDNFNIITEDITLEIKNYLKKSFNSEDLSKINVDLVTQLIHLNATDPFIKQENISKLLSISKDDLIYYNSILRKVPEFQKFMTNFGVASKFLKNTIFPVIQSGSLESYTKKKISSHLRLAFFLVYPACSNVHFVEEIMMPYTIEVN